MHLLFITILKFAEKQRLELGGDCTEEEKRVQKCWRKMGHAWHWDLLREGCPTGMLELVLSNRRTERWVRKERKENKCREKGNSSIQSHRIPRPEIES